MPIFDFKCQECGYQFDLIISNAHKDQAKCPQCGTDKLQQLLSAFSSPKQGSSNDACAGCISAGTGG